MDWQQERRSFWERICVAHVASYALAEQPVAMADRLVRAWEERFPKPAAMVRYDPQNMMQSPEGVASEAANVRKPYQCPDCGGYVVGGGCTCSPEKKRLRWEEARTEPYGPNKIITSIPIAHPDGSTDDVPVNTDTLATAAKPIDPVDAILKRFGVK